MSSQEMEQAAAWARLCESPVEPCIQRQYVSAVKGFSSEYGSGDSNWGACNIVGDPRVYPSTGDNPKAWAPRQYTGLEFIEFEVAQPCIPSKFEIYETLTPGALVKISAKVHGNWIPIWTGQSKQLEAARIFEPAPIAQIDTPTNTFRFDINQTGWSSWYEIDAIAVTGDVSAVPVIAYTPPAPKTLAADLLALFLSQTGDVTFETPTGELVKAHMAILAARAPSLLKSHESLIRVPDHPTVLRTVLTFLYSDTADLPVSLAVPVHVAAVRWGLDALAELSAKRFRAALTKANIFKVLQFVDDIAGLRQVCVQYIVANPATLIQDTQGSASHALTPSQLAALVDLFARSLVRAP